MVDYEGQLGFDGSATRERSCFSFAHKREVHFLHKLTPYVCMILFACSLFVVMTILVSARR